MAEEFTDQPCHNADVIRDWDQGLTDEGGIVVLRGNLAPDGAVLKPSAASEELMRHTGKAVVFEDIDDYHARIDDPDLDVDADSVLVLKNCGPRGFPGMAEVGNMALPAKILKQGVRDMVRISDARMSGTAYGTVVLHSAPEAAAGGPIAFIKSGDVITLDVAARKLHVDVSDEELEARKQGFSPAKHADSGFQRLFVDHVLQADEGCDFDFLVGQRGAQVGRHSH
jgi:dihydroxyacid dehydratase/phosphogluconate dehydratase